MYTTKCVSAVKRALTSGVAPIGTVRIRLDELADGEAIGGFLGADGYVLAHE